MANNITKHLFVWLGLTLAVAVFVTTEAVVTKRCVLRCSRNEVPVWATDTNVCSGFRNKCYFNYANCLRRNRGETELTVLNRKACQSLCPQICTLQYSPLCAEYNGKNRTFGNSCAMRGYICTTGETYVLIRPGDCAGTNLDA
ncbi:four-domain proteases inhibitor-like [Eurosta solidaginis]|uniref:four-domain proteases inhibitor-like n=1 Tax=Eurosta solidaginis TaxID=178769 RepID=UPI003530824E